MLGCLTHARRNFVPYSLSDLRIAFRSRHLFPKLRSNPEALFSRMDRHIRDNSTAQPISYLESRMDESGIDEKFDCRPPVSPSRTVLLIDGSPLVYRSYYAVPKKPGMKPLNAVFGFLQSILKIIRENPCDYLAVCLEGKSNFRRTLDSTYKANRKKIDDSLLEQFPIIEEALNAMGVKIAKIDEYEADDVICTLAKKAQEANYSALIISPDKDLLQVLGPNIQVLSKSELITHSSFLYNKKISPQQWPDYQAMIGDRTDNVPRVLSPGAALRLLESYGSLENIIKNADSIPMSDDRVKVKTSIEVLERNLKLVSMNTQLPIDLEQFQFSNISFQKTKEFLVKYSLRSILKSVENMQNSSGGGLESKSATSLSTENSRKSKISYLLEKHEQLNLPTDFKSLDFNCSVDPMNLEFSYDSSVFDELGFEQSFGGPHVVTRNFAAADPQIPLLESRFDNQNFVEHSKKSSESSCVTDTESLVQVTPDDGFQLEVMDRSQQAMTFVDEENSHVSRRRTRAPSTRGAEEKVVGRGRKKLASVRNVNFEELGIYHGMSQSENGVLGSFQDVPADIIEEKISTRKFFADKHTSSSSSRSASNAGSTDPDLNYQVRMTQKKKYSSSRKLDNEDAYAEDDQYQDAVEYDEKDSESNLSLVNFIKNRKSVEVDLKFVNLFNLCKTSREFRVLIESKIPGVNVVNDLESAEKVCAKLMQIENEYHACDTETMSLDVKRQSPVNNGKVICFTIYCGPNQDFGNGPHIWVDCLKDENVMLKFKDYFENSKIKKVWHNYGFDRHVIWNCGVDCQGFGGDTMHMARLWDASLKGARAYSLEYLSAKLLDSSLVKKTGMKKRFGLIKLKKDGTQAKSSVFMPELASLQQSAESILEWIDYATTDARNTWEIRQILEEKLRCMSWNEDGSMWDFYIQYWLPFGELLTEVERTGFKVDQDYLKSLIPLAESDIKQKEDLFIQWAQMYVCEECKFMNPRSDAQKQQLFFAPCVNTLDSTKVLSRDRVFQTENVDNFIEEGKKKPKKMRNFVISGLGLPFDEPTQSGWPAVANNVLSKLAGNPPFSYGKLLEYFEERGLAGGREGCEALTAVVESNKVQTLLNTFIVPLATYTDVNSRIHCSLNINTETGRLSSRRPNLQNQPASEKDKFKIRKAFVSEKDNTLIVADYGQLELRLLAHITKCRSMIEAFESGGDFHSRTAVSMYPNVKKAIADGQVLLEWDSKLGQPTLPLLKDVFKMERRRAKTLNFSIAYGKTMHGLARDWNVSISEARDTLDRWYSDRPEVLQWQQDTIRQAHETGYTRSLLGRYRQLPEINSRERLKRSHAERAAINTPLQGGAADIVTAAMIKLYKNERIRELSWKQILQIHDEIILEGPRESAEEVMEIVRNCMSNPISSSLLVDLLVDVKCADNWDEAK